MRTMRLLARVGFGGAAALLLYTWVGYPLILKVLSSRKAPPSLSPPMEWPMVTAFTCVYNEEKVIEQKIENLLSLDYPCDRLQILITSDGSTDRTNEIVRSYADRGVELYVRPERGGTTAAFNDSVERSRGEILVHSDADTIHAQDYLRKIIPHYSDPKVGVVEGEFRMLNEDASGLAQNQGVYWRFEMFLRKAESRLGVLSHVSGAIMSFRRDVYEPLLPSQPGDGVISKLAIEKGYRVVHEPEAIAYEQMVKSVSGELRARIRMTSRNLLGWGGSEALLNPRKYPGVSVALVSHKLLRWLTPFFMLGAFASNLALLKGRVFRLMLLGQAAFYTSALVGFLLELCHVRIRLFSVPFSFCWANAGFLIGLLKALRQEGVSIYRSEE